MKTSLLLPALTASFLSAAFSASATSIVTSFDTGLEGWTEQGSGFGPFLTYSASGGNPGGFGRFGDAANTPDLYAVAPAAFLGNLSAFDGGTVSFDAKFFPGILTNPVAGFGLIEISNGGTSVSQDIAPVTPDGNWQTFSGAFTAAGFGTSQATWNSILANVTSFTIQVDAYKPVQSGPAVGLDNITIVPEPASGTLLILAGVALAPALFRSRRK